MSNEDRIKGWRARRKDSSYAVGSRRLGLAAGPGRAVRGPGQAGRAARRCSRLQGEPHDSVAARRTVYEAVQAELDAEIARAGVDETLADFPGGGCASSCGCSNRTSARASRYSSRATCRPGWKPRTSAWRRRTRGARNGAGRGARRATPRLAPRHRAGNGAAPGEAGDLAILRARLNGLHARHQPRAAGEGWPSGRTLLALFVYQLHVMHGESRIALLWALVGPVVLLTLISSLYILMGTHYILGMDVQTFSLLGATTWIMFRQIVFRSSTAYVSARGLLNFQGVTPLMCALVQALLYVSVYLVVFVVLIGAGHALELITLPRSWPGFMLYVVLMACCAAAMGLLFGAIATFWHFFLRLAPVIERFLQIFSGVFFVSEQLPEHLRPWMLWLPFAHGMQLLRSAYFDAYASQDASLGYFLTSLVFLMVLALAAERLARPNVQPM